MSGRASVSGKPGTCNCRSAGRCRSQRFACARRTVYLRQAAPHVLRRPAARRAARGKTDNAPPSAHDFRTGKSGSTDSEASIYPLTHLENTLDLYSNIAWQRAHADCDPRSDAGVVAKHFGHQIGKTIDDLRMILELRRGVDHAECLDQ